ncbi:MAG: hypothetical protein LBG63_04190, partial [Candidatus Methanoplasma sp.]|nr:hypothetical protein [Candidatus Methanoplasma sp.]
GCDDHKKGWVHNVNHAIIDLRNVKVDGGLNVPKDNDNPYSDYDPGLRAFTIPSRSVPGSPKVGFSANPNCPTSSAFLCADFVIKFY